MKDTFLMEYLSKFDQVPFSVEMNDGSRFNIGDGSPEFEIEIKESISKIDLLKSTSLALGEAYMKDKIIIKGDLFYALNLFMGQMNKFNLNRRLLKNLMNTSNSILNQKKEVCSHYNIGNDFYKLWLDETLSYSCAYFKSEKDSLYEAQINKIHHILAKLNLKPGMSLLDIGCGWGCLLIEATKKYKIKGTGITLSEEQFHEFNDRIKKENLEDSLTVKLIDYRELHKIDMKFDRVVSVGMIEHVGRENYPLFLKEIDSILKEKGLFLLHYISSLQEHNGDPWMRKYIFPGGVIPSLREIIHLCGDMNYYTIDVESLRRHYVKTLLYWNKNFQENKPTILNMFNHEFVRMWELYLCTCASTFNNGIIDLHQILLSKGPNNDLPITRDYMY